MLVPRPALLPGLEIFSCRQARRCGRLPPVPPAVEPKNLADLGIVADGGAENWRRPHGLDCARAKGIWCWTTGLEPRCGLPRRGKRKSGEAVAIANGEAQPVRAYIPEKVNVPAIRAKFKLSQAATLPAVHQSATVKGR